MTQQKKPDKKEVSRTSPDYDGREYASERWNDAIEEMEAYYLPIVMELLEVLQCVCDDVGDENADIRTKTYLKVLQALAKYKELK